MRPIKELNKIYKECRQLLIDNGYKVPLVQSITLASLPKSVFGRCCGRMKLARIEINMTYYLNADIEDLKNTIIHEICHQISPTYGHSKEWKKIAKDVTEKTGYKIETYAKREKAVYTGVVYKYAVVCSNCGTKSLYQRKSNAVKNPLLYKCGKCGKSHTLVTIEL